MLSSIFSKIANFEDLAQAEIVCLDWWALLFGGRHWRYLLFNLFIELNVRSPFKGPQYVSEIFPEDEGKTTQDVFLFLNLINIVAQV